MESLHPNRAWALSPIPLFWILGWSLGAYWLENRTSPTAAPIQVKVPIGAGGMDAEVPVTPLELRVVPGVGRTRSRDLVQGLWERGWGAGVLESANQLEEVRGIGPVTAQAVERWAASEAPGTYTGTQEINPAVARLPPQPPRVHRKSATARSAARFAREPAPELP